MRAAAGLCTRRFTQSGNLPSGGSFANSSAKNNIGFISHGTIALELLIVTAQSIIVKEIYTNFWQYVYRCSQKQTTSKHEKYRRMEQSCFR